LRDALKRIAREADEEAGCRLEVSTMDGSWRRAVKVMAELSNGVRPRSGRGSRVNFYTFAEAT